MSARARARALSVLALSIVVLFTNSVSAALVASGGGGRWSFDRSEKCLMRKINRTRQRNGLGGLGFDKQVGVVARRHAKSMANNYSVYHDYNMDNEITRWKRLGQNTGAGAGCDSLFRSFMNSSSHRHNILGRWRHIGVGTDRRGGRLFVQAVFESRRDPGNIWHYP